MASQSDDRATSPDPASPSARDPHNDQPHVDDHQPDASIKASRSVTIEERSVSPSSRAMRTESQVTANTVSTIATTSSFDPLHQYQKALEYLERKNQFVEKERKRREDKERSEAPHHPFLSLYVQNAIKKGERSTRTVIDVAEANDEWEKQRRQHLQKKRNMVEKERAEEYAQHKHVDAHSEQICQQKGHLPIHKSWQEVQKIQAQRREKLAQMLKPTFAPETYSHLESRRARSVAARPTAKSGLLNERSRSQVAERLHKEFQRRVERRERELKEMEEAKQTQEKELEERIVGHTKRTKEEIDEHLELLSQWHQRKEAVQELRRKLHDDDINLTFQPYVSQYSRHLAIAARYHHPVEVPPPPPKRNHSKPRNRRVENIKPANVARCKPLPHAFLVRSERMLAAKEQRTKELLRRDEEMHVKSCTFAPSINPVSDAIMRLTSPASTPQGPRFMKPTEVAVRRATPSEEALHVDDAHLYRSDSFAHAHGHPQQHAHQSAPAYQHTASSSDQYDSVQRRSRQAEPLGRSPSLRSDAPASPAPKTAPVHHDTVHATDVPLTLGDKFEEMRATLALWNQLANAASP